MSDKWVDMGQKLLTPDMKAKLLNKINGIDNNVEVKNEDTINQPAHYQGKTLELTDVYQDFFEATTVQDKYIMDMCIEIENNKTKGLNDS